MGGESRDPVTFEYTLCSAGNEKRKHLFPTVYLEVRTSKNWNNKMGDSLIYNKQFKNASQNSNC